MKKAIVKILCPIAKMFCPGAETLAGYAAESIAKKVNGTEADTKAKIARIASTGAKLTAISNQLMQMAADGTLDEQETGDLKKLLTPGFAAALDYAFSW